MHEPRHRVLHGVFVFMIITESRMIHGENFEDLQAAVELRLLYVKFDISF